MFILRSDIFRYILLLYIKTFPILSPNVNFIGLGKLSEWGSWGECNDCICKKGKNYCYGKKHRTQKCLSIHDKTKELEDYDCPAVEVAKTRKDCICVDKVKVECKFASYY